jgi:aspartate aminotransferase
MIKYSGMETVYLKTEEGQIDLDDLRKKIIDCRAIIINSPSNPTGRVESINTLKEIESLANQYGVFVISDEVYKDLIYIQKNYSIAGPHVITINSFSKTYGMCGLRVGYLWSLDNTLIKDIIQMKTHTSMNTNILGQAMAMKATKTPRSFIREQLKVWQDRRNLLYNGLKKIDPDLWNPEGAFYMLPKIEKSAEFVWDMYRKYDVISYMGAWFGAPGRVRFSYALDKKKIEEGLFRINEYLNSRHL